MSSEPISPNSSHLLVGLTGTNPLAALAALGTIRVLSSHWSDGPVRMSWKLATGQWRPVLHFDKPVTSNDIVQCLCEALDVAEHMPEFCVVDDDGKPRKNLGDISPKDFSSMCIDAIELSSNYDRRQLDFLAAYGSDAVDKDDEKIADTALRTMSGSGHQHFLGFIREIVNSTTAGHIRSTLFARWNYADEKPAMRWDPHDDRRHALMALRPSNQSKGNEIRTMRGANRLAIEALPMFPTFPTNSGVKTRGFREVNGGIWLTWPIWTPPITEAAISALLGHGQILGRQTNRRKFSEFGVAEIYRAKRITNGYFRNFSLGRPTAGERAIWQS